MTGRLGRARRLVCAASATMALAGCGGLETVDNNDEMTQETTAKLKLEVGGGATIIPTPEGIRDFVLSGFFKSWPSKTERRDARQDHKLAKTYYSPIFVQGKTSHLLPMPLGSLAINEENFSGGTEAEGYSLAVKVVDDLDQDSWVWWQARAEDLKTPSTFGYGHPECNACHSLGVDRVLAEKLPF